MNPTKIVTVVGARPQFVKAAVLSRVFRNMSNVKEVIVHTGQHFDANMSEVFFEEMEIPRPHYNLKINGLGHGAMTGQMLEKIEEVLLVEKPNWVLVYGDTNSTLAGALAAKKLHIKVAHVEAGLRSFNNKMPEEVNRILTDRISDILFCPTRTAECNLENEGYSNLDCTVINCGDVMQDAALFYSQKALKPSFYLPEKYILATVHRAENTDNEFRLLQIFKAMEHISQSVPIVIPLHPRTKNKLKSAGYDFSSSGLICVDPVGYLEMVYMLTNCKLVMTDSGGLQKEAYFFKKICLTLRDETEWIELIESRYNFLCGNTATDILHAYNKVLEMKRSKFSTDLYGDGTAGEKIAMELIKRTTENE